MHDVIGVEHHKSIENAANDCCGVLFLILASLLDLVKQFLTLKILNDQVDVTLRFKYLIQLQHVGMPNLAQQRYLVVQAKCTLHIVFVHLLVYGFQSELTASSLMSRFEDHRKVSLANQRAIIVVTAHVLQDSKVFEQFVPFLDLVAGTRALAEHNHLVDEPDDDALFEVQARSAGALFR